MHKPLRRLGALLAVATATLVAAPAQAAYTSLTVFGDSLSDTGNIFAITGGALPVAPYLPGRFSDGPVWVETLAQGLGLPGAAGSVLQGAGLNFAFGGARTGVANNPPGVLAQVGGLWAPGNPTADPNGLYVVVGGGNDMRDARDGVSTPASRQAAATAAAGNIAQSVGLLASRGARNVLISTLPDLGNTPEAAFLGLIAESSDATMRYNALVMGLEPMLEAMFPGLDVMVLDMFGIANSSPRKFYSLPALARQFPNVKRLPVSSLRIVLESVLRNCDGKKVTPSTWPSSRTGSRMPRAREIPFVVARVVLQDFTGVPLLADLAAMRNVAAEMGKDPRRIEPLVPVDLVVDHSVMIDHYGSRKALT
jgi:hypothetical protein